MLCQVYFNFKNLNVQSVVYQFYFNKMKKEQLLRKLKGKLENEKKQKQISQPTGSWSENPERKGGIKTLFLWISSQLQG